MIAGLLGAALVGPPAADGRWDAALLASASAREQATSATSVADLAASGRYLVFQTTARNLFADAEQPGTYREGGIFRRDLESGELDLVVAGTLRNADDDRFMADGGRAPSVSADGRHVAFSTSKRLAPEDTNSGNSDVYVRDMAVPIGQPGAFTLVSAIDGSDEVAGYDGSFFGSFVPNRGAISADGRKVVFHTLGPRTNLPQGGPADSPSLQVYVRDLAARTTTLVSARRDAQTGLATGEPAGRVSDGAARLELSADGTTVAWVDANWSEQARAIDGEPVQRPALLWRRIADGPLVPARRVFSWGDPDDPGCASDARVVQNGGTGACYGPFDFNQGAPAEDNHPGPFSLSADGRTVGFITQELPRGLVQAQARGTADAFVADMRDGVPRKQAVRELTRQGADETDARDSSPILEVGTSGDGRRVVLSTRRITFRLPRPRLSGDAPPTVRSIELYAVDLEQESLELVTRGYDGSQTDDGGASTVGAFPVLAHDGAAIGFVSLASNLFFGDGNGVADAFLIKRRGADRLFPPPPQALPPPPPHAQVGLERRIRLTLEPISDGSLHVHTVVPQAGDLRAGARQVVRVKRGKRRSARTTLGRTVGHDSLAASEPGQVTLVIEPSRKWTRKLRSRRGLEVSVLVRFGAPGEQALARRVRVTLRDSAGAARARRRAGDRARRRVAERRAARRTGGPGR